jgi:hypothetical protein
MQSTLPDGGQQWLHEKPLNAAIGRAPARIALVAAMFIVVGVRKNTTHN